MKNILLPTDFSENSWNAIAYALQLFKNDTCMFHLLNTYTPTIFQYDYTNTGTAQHELADVMRENSEEKLEALVNKIKQAYNNPKHSFATMSAFNTLISELAELHEGHVMDMIIMGTQGASGLKEILFGSNTIHVIKNSKCPVIAVPSNFSFARNKFLTMC